MKDKTMFMNDYGKCRAGEEEQVKSGWWNVGININCPEHELEEMFEDGKEALKYRGPIAQYLDHEAKVMLKDAILEGNHSGIIGMSGTSWDLDIQEVTLDGEDIKFRDLSEISQEHIIDSIVFEGNYQGDIYEEEYVNVYEIYGIGNGIHAPLLASGTIEELIEQYEDGKLEGNSSFMAALYEAEKYDYLDEFIADKERGKAFSKPKAFMSFDDIINDAKERSSNYKKEASNQTKDIER